MASSDIDLEDELVFDVVVDDEVDELEAELVDDMKDEFESWLCLD